MVVIVADLKLTRPSTSITTKVYRNKCIFHLHSERKINKTMIIYDYMPNQKRILLLCCQQL